MGAHGIQTPPESLSLTGHGRGYRISGWGVWCGSHTQPNGPDRIAPVRQPNSLTTAAAQTASVVRFRIEADGLASSQIATGEEIVPCYRDSGHGVTASRKTERP